MKDQKKRKNRNSAMMSLSHEKSAVDSSIINGSSAIDRRSFLLLLLLASGCSSTPKIVQRDYYEVLPPSYRLMIYSKNNQKSIEGRSLRIDRKKVVLREETYIEKYSARASGFSDTGRKLVFNPGAVMGCLAAWPICAAAAGIAALHTATNPSESKYLEKEQSIIKSEKINETINEQALSDRERAINIIISNSQNYRELVIVNTDKSGSFILNFDKVVIENMLEVSDYKVEFFHNLIDTPVVNIIPASVVASIINEYSAALRLSKMRQSSADKARTLSYDRTNWFYLVGKAWSIKDNVELAREVYLLYREYRFERLFFEMLFKRVLVPSIVAFAVEEAIKYFVLWLLRTHRDELIRIFGREVIELIPV